MLHQKLLAREAEGRPVRVGIIGAGTFGTQIIAQTCRMKGMRISVIADLVVDRSRRALKLGGIESNAVREAKSVADINHAIEVDCPAITLLRQRLAQ